MLKLKLDKGLFPILLTVTLMGFGMSFVTPLIPLIIKGTGSSLSTIGQIGATYFLFFTIVTPFWGKKVDKIGSKKVMLIGLTAYAVSVLFIPYIKTAFAFYIIRALQGMSTASLFVATESAINILSSPENRGKNMGYYALVFGLGFAGGPAVGATLFAINRYLPFYLCSASFFLATFLFLFTFKDTKIEIKSPVYRYKDFFNILRIPLASVMCYAFIEVCIGVFLALYLDSINIRGTYLGLVFTAFALGAMLSPVPCGRVADVFGKLPTIYTFAFLLTLVIFSFNFFQSFLLIILLISGVGFIAGGLYPVALSIIADLIPKDKIGAANSTFAFSYGIGSIIGPLVTGKFIDYYGIKYLFYPMTAVTLIFLLISVADASNKLLKWNQIKASSSSQDQQQ